MFSILLEIVFQMEFDEKELRREISYAIRNIHGIRYVQNLITDNWKSLLISCTPVKIV